MPSLSRKNYISGEAKMPMKNYTYRGSCPEVFLEKGVLKICCKFTGEHSCRSAISIKLQSNYIEITLRHGCSPVNLLHLFRTPFLKNTSGRLLLHLKYIKVFSQRNSYIPLTLKETLTFFLQICK